MGKDIEPATKCAWHAEKINDLEIAVFGNGQEGLKTGVTKLREHVRLLLWLNGIIATSMIVAITAALIKHLLE